MAGRPPKREADRRKETLRIRLTEDELQILEIAANGAKTSTWARDVLIRNAKRKATTVRANWSQTDASNSAKEDENKETVTVK